MSTPIIGLVSIGGILLLIQAGMPIAIALMVVCFVSAWAIMGSIAIAGNLVFLSAAESISSYTFGVIPLFMLMGLLISVSEVGKDTFSVASQVFRRLRGGVGMATVAANAVFAAVTGTSIASAAVFSRIAVPEMMRLGYAPRFSVGVVAGSSVLGMLIPPSLLMIIFGVIAGVSIGDLFTAGILPGLLLTFCYILLISGMVRFTPGFVGERPSRPIDGAAEVDLMPLPELLTKLIPIVILILLILGGIYGGIFTPTEAGAAGALGALLIAIARRRLTLRRFWQVLTEAGHVTASISILLIGAHMYSRMLALSGLPSEVANWAINFSVGSDGILVLYLIAVIMLGTILDAVAILLILVPLALPALEAQNVNLIWFGIMSVLAVEIGLLTPPLGLSCFVVKANIGEAATLSDVFRGALPFAATMAGVLAIIFIWPWFTTALL